MSSDLFHNYRHYRFVCAGKFFIWTGQNKWPQMVFKTAVIGLERISDGYNIRVQQPSGESSFKNRVVISCTDLHSDKVVEIVGIHLNRQDTQRILPLSPKP